LLDIFEKYEISLFLIKKLGCLYDNIQKYDLLIMTASEAFGVSQTLCLFLGEKRVFGIC
jgi:hypothetical protein